MSSSSCDYGKVTWSLNSAVSLPSRCRGPAFPTISHFSGKSGATGCQGTPHCLPRGIIVPGFGYLRDLLKGQSHLQCHQNVTCGLKKPQDYKLRTLLYWLSSFTHGPHQPWHSSQRSQMWLQNSSQYNILNNQNLSRGKPTCHPTRELQALELQASLCTVPLLQTSRFPGQPCSSQRQWTRKSLRFLSRSPWSCPPGHWATMDRTSCSYISPI